MNELLETPVYECPLDNHDVEVDEAEQTVISTESALATLTSISKRLASIGKINRDTANTIRTLTTGMESMDVHFSRHPVNSYTAVAGNTNLKVTQEGVISTIASAVWAAIKAAWNFITSVFKSIFGAAERNEAKFEQVEVTVSKVLKAHPVPRTPGTKEAPQRGSAKPVPEAEVKTLDEKQRAAIVKINSNAFAYFLCRHDTPEGFPIKCQAVQVPKLLVELEQVMSKSLSGRLSEIRGAVMHASNDKFDASQIDALAVPNYAAIVDVLHTLFKIDSIATDDAATLKRLMELVLRNLDRGSSFGLSTVEQGMELAKVVMIERKAELFSSIGFTQTLAKTLRKNIIRQVDDTNISIAAMRKHIPSDDNTTAGKLRNLSTEVSNLSSAHGYMMSYNTRYQLACSTASNAALAFWL